MMMFDTRVVEDRLKEVEQLDKNLVGGAAQYAGVKSLGDFRTGSIYVVLAKEHNAAQNSNQPLRKAPATATFGVIVVARNYRDQTGRAAKDDLAPLVGAVREALIGWAPDGCKPIAWLQGDVLDYDRTNLLWIDVFSTMHVLGA